MDFVQIATLVIVFTLVGVIVVVVTGLTAVPSRILDSRVAAARRHANVTTVVAVAAGLIAAGLTVKAEPQLPHVGRVPGLGPLLAPLAFGLVHTLVIGVGELAWPRPRGHTRTARLVPRPTIDALRNPLGRLAVGATVLGLVAATVGALTATGDGASGYLIGYGDNQRATGFGLLFYGGGAAYAATDNAVPHWAGLIVAAIGVIAGLTALGLLCVPAPRLRPRSQQAYSTSAIGGGAGAVATAP